LNEKATGDELSALVWQLRDAARTRSFDSIHIPQKQVDADGKTVWFHIYRGSKCAPEKYAPGNPPCGASYHAAADYTLDTHTTPPWDKGAILHGADDPHPTLLWDPDAPYTPPTPPKSVAEALDHFDQIGAKPISVRGHLWLGKGGSMLHQGKDVLLLGYSDQFSSAHSFTALIQSVRRQKSDAATLTGKLSIANGKKYLIVDQIAFED